MRPAQLGWLPEKISDDGLSSDGASSDCQSDDGGLDNDIGLSINRKANQFMSMFVSNISFSQIFTLEIRYICLS